MSTIEHINHPWVWLEAAHPRRPRQSHSGILRSMWAAADIETNDIILSVTEAELKSLVALLLDPTATEIDLESGPGKPALRSLSALRIVLGEGSVRIALVDDHARRTGGREGFARLGREVTSFAEHNDLNEPGMHAHFDLGSALATAGAPETDSVDLIITGPMPYDATP